MPPYSFLIANQTNTLSSFSTTSANCPGNGGVKIALGVISILLAVSEFLSLNKRIPAAGIIQGISMAFNKKTEETEAAPASEAEAEPAIELRESDATSISSEQRRQDEATIEKMVTHAKDGLSKLSIKING